MNLPLPAYIDPEAWAGFVEMRKKVKAPLTTRAATLILFEVQRIKDAGHDPNAALDQSTMRCWKGVWPKTDEAPSRTPALEAELAEAKRREREAFEATQTPEGRAKVRSIVEAVKGAINRRQA